jgi:hypothetical protein
MPVHSAPKRDKTHPDGRANQLRHHILTLGTHSETDSDIEIVDSVELGMSMAAASASSAIFSLRCSRRSVGSSQCHSGGPAM